MTETVDLEDWAKHPGEPPLPAASGYAVRLWNDGDFSEKRRIKDATPTTEQVLEEFGLRPARDYVLLVRDRHGVSEIPLGHTIDISDRRAEQFFAFKTERTYKVELNGDRFSWGAPTISVEILRLLGRIPDHHQLLLSRKNEVDLVLEPEFEVNLATHELEIVTSEEPTWKLKVQGVLLKLTESKISVRDALIKAGINPDDGWTAALKIKGSPREAIGLPRRDFNLHETDADYLQKRGLQWDAVLDGASRWVILRRFPFPEGYTASFADIAIQIPATYPQAALDMFYCQPFAQLKSGRQIPATESRQSILGQSYQRWSRHRSSSTRWNPDRDSLITHIAIIDDALSREVE